MALDKEETSERVLQIALRLLEEGGAANLKARTIAQEAGIAVGSIYNMFTDLNGLHRAANMRLLDELGERGAAAMVALGSKGDTRERLLALAHTYHAFVQEHPGAWAALLAYNRGRIHDMQPDAYVERLEALFEIIGHVIAQGDPELPKEVTRRVARALWSSVHGIVANGYAAGSGSRRGEEIWAQVDLMVTTFLEGMRHRRDFLTAEAQNP